MPDSRSDKKRELILTKAHQVFIRKGFASTTMKDIVDECEISRGGVYLYFKSVDEIFMQLILTRNSAKLNETRACIAEDKSFKELIDEYFEKQKKRLMNMENSLLMAMHEYRFANRSNNYNEIFHDQYLNTKTVILELLNYGARQGDIKNKDVEDLAINIMLFIEGISTLAVTSKVSEKVIDSQINFVKNIIFTNRD